MKAFVLVFALGACSYKSPADPTDGAIPDDGDVLPDMLIDDEDDDNDGVLDGDDNCPLKANADQHDEDDDDTGDICDPCPMFASDDDEDDDSDGIGDLCDPHPDTPGDVLLTFEGFGVRSGRATCSPSRARTMSAPPFPVRELDRERRPTRCA